MDTNEMLSGSRFLDGLFVSFFGRPFLDLGFIEIFLAVLFFTGSDQSHIIRCAFCDIVFPLPSGNALCKHFVDLFQRSAASFADV